MELHSRSKRKKGAFLVSFLQWLNETKDAYVVLLQLGIQRDADLPRGVRQSAMINLKNFASGTVRGPKDFDLREMSDEERVAISEVIVPELLQEPDQNVLNAGAFLFGSLVVMHGVDSLPDLADHLTNGLRSDDVQVLINTLVLIRDWWVRVRYMGRDMRERDDLNKGQEVLNEHILNAAGSALDADVGDAAATMVLVRALEAYFALIEFKTSGIAMEDPDHGFQWLELLLAAYSRPIPAEVLPEIEYDRQRSPHMQLRKVCGFILCRWVTRFMSTSERFLPSPEVEPLVVRFRNDMVHRFIDPCLQVVTEFMGGGDSKWTTKATFCDALLYIRHAITKVSAWRVLKPHVPDLLADVVVPVYTFNESDQELWEDDPVAYVHENYSRVGVDTDVRGSVASFVLALTSTRKDVGRPAVMRLLRALFRDAFQVLRRDDNRDSEEGMRARFQAGGVMDAGLRLLGGASSDFVASKSVGRQIESIMTRYVIPCMEMPEPNVRAQAIRTFGEYAALPWRAMENYERGLGLALDSLVDEQRPVRFMAATALRYLVKNPAAQRLLAPHTEKIVSTFIELSQDLASDDVVEALDQVITVLGVNVRAHVVELVRELVLLFSNLLDAEAEAAEEEDDDRAAAANFGAMRALETTATTIRMLSPLDEHQCDEIEVFIEPILIRVFTTEELLEFFEDGLSLLSTFVLARQRRPFSATMWKLAETLIDSLSTYAIDLIAEIRRPLCYMIAADPEGFLDWRCERGDPTLMKRMWGAHEYIVENNHLIDGKFSARIVQAIFLHCSGPEVHELAPHAAVRSLEMATNPIGENDQGEPTSVMISTIWAALLYHPESVMEALEGAEEGAMLKVLELTSATMEKENRAEAMDLKLCILGLTQVLEMVPDRVPESIVAHLPQLLTLLLEFVNFRFHEAAELPNPDGEKEGEGDDDDDSSVEIDDEDEGGEEAFMDDDEVEGAGDGVDVEDLQDDEEYAELLEAAMAAGYGRDDGKVKVYHKGTVSRSGGDDEPVTLGEMILTGGFDDVASEDEIDGEGDDEEGYKDRLATTKYLPVPFTPLWSIDTLAKFYHAVETFRENAGEAADAAVEALDSDASVRLERYHILGKEHYESNDGQVARADLDG